MNNSVVVPEPIPEQPEAVVIAEVLPTKEPLGVEESIRVEEVKTIDDAVEAAD